jgi:undecaprenyl-diphosphatase
MSLWDAIILGVIQGLTEFLPISSSAHVRIVGELLPSTGDPGATFTAITQIGTEIAVLIYFWKDITSILGSWFARFIRKDLDPSRQQEARLGWLIIIGTLPIVVVGYTAQELIRNAFRSLWLVATVLIVFGIVLYVADRLGRQQRTLETLSVGHGLSYGLAQTLALIPGVSRSGATIAMGRSLGYTRTEALRFSFLLAVPAVLGSGFYELRTAIVDPVAAGAVDPVSTAVATLIAFVVGYAVIAWLMRFIKSGSFLPFVIYRVALGLVLFALLGTGVISA